MLGIEPSEAQKRAGNYAKHHVTLHGLPITIENRRGATRAGVGRDGKAWRVTMPAHYGYFKRSEAADGDHVDCYIGPHPKSRFVLVIDQRDADTKRFDEHKCMLGFANKAQALSFYKRGFSDGKGDARVGSYAEMDIDRFKDWLRNEDTTKRAARASGGRVQEFADGGAPKFDPDAFLSGPSTPAAPPGGFDPDSFLKGAPSAAAPQDAKPTGTLPRAVEKAIEPITSYPSTYMQMNKDARDQMSRGVEQLSSPDGAWEAAKGAGNVGLGAVNYMMSPVSAALRTVVGKPLEENLGIPKEYSEFAASFALPVPGVGLSRRTVAAPVAPAVPTASEIRAAAKAAYEAPEVAALKLHPQVMPITANIIRDDLASRGFDPLLAPKTFGLIEKAEQAVPADAAFVGANNFQTLRRMLGKAAESVDPTERAAAKIAQTNIDSIMSRIPAAAVIEGDAQAASRILSEARGNYAAASRTDMLQTALTKAGRQAESAGLGGNWENATRQRVRDILNSPAKSRGLSAEEKIALEDYVGGNFTRNSLRAATKILGGDNPLMAAIHAGLAFPTSGMTLAAPVTGFLLKKINNAVSGRQLAQLDEMLRSRSPLADSLRSDLAAWAHAEGRQVASSTNIDTTRAFLAARALSDRLRSGGIEADLKQLFGPLQGTTPSRADEQQQQ